MILTLVLVALAVSVSMMRGLFPSSTAASSPPPFPSPTASAKGALEWRALRNAVYPTSLQQGTVTLRDGIFEQAAAPGSASLVTVRLADFAGFGRLDGDGAVDAAVILTTSGGGSGVFIDLVAVRNESGVAHPIARVQLGDRVLVREVRVDGGIVVVRLRDRGSGDPLATLTTETVRRYRLVADRLELIDETQAQVPVMPPQDFVYQPQPLSVAAGTSQTVVGALGPAQIASYTLHGEAGQILDLHLRSDFNNAVLSVSGLSDATTLVSRQEYATDRTITLPAAQDYGIRVVGLAGHQLPFTLAVGLRPGPGASPSPRPTGGPTLPPTPRPSGSPSGSLEHPLETLSEPAHEFLSGRAPTWGIAVVDASDRTVYAENADDQVPTASVVKVLVMLVVLERARAEGRPVSEAELALLWPMITASDNDSTSALWEDIGRGRAVSSYLSAIGVAGITPDPGRSWGVTFASARGMATVLGKLLLGEILDAPSRALALRLMESVISAQRWGISAGARDSDRVALKNGWYPGDEGWRINSVGIVRPATGPSYAIAVMTDSRPSMSEGVETIEGAAERVRSAIAARVG